nr:DUF1107 domain-containing protein [Shewanella gelidimarina]
MWGGLVRVFPVYAPKLIVKHARIFLTGVIWVKDLGRIEFDKGRFLLPRKSLPKVKQAILELNGLIETQNSDMQTA